MDICVSDDLSKAEVKMPGLGLMDVERTGSCLSAWQIARLFESASTKVYNIDGKSFMESTGLAKLYMDYVKCASHRVMTRFFENDIQSSLLSVKMQIGYIGRTSYEWYAYIENKEAEILAEARYVLVNVDKINRRPTTLPDWWLTQFKSKMPLEAKAAVVQPLEPPPEGVEVHQYHMICAWHDIDAFSHLNNSNFLRYCLEAASDASSKSLLQGFSGNMFCKHLKQMTQLYISECKAGDKITINVWQEPKNNTILYFKITIEKDVVYESTLEFYTSTAFEHSHL